MLTALARPAAGLLLALLVPALLPAQSPAPGNALQRIIDAGLARGESVIRIPAGRYEVHPTKGTHLRLHGLKDVTIEAAGVEMICKETTLAVHLKDCSNVRIHGLTIDYDPLPFTQGRIVEISPDRKAHTIEIMDGFPAAESAYFFKHSIYTAEGELRFGNYFQYQLEVLPNQRLKVFALSPRVDGGEQLGDIVVVSARHLKGSYTPHAIVVEDSRATVLEGIRLYSSPCFGFFERGSSGSVYRNCVVDRRAGRVHSLNADAFHSKHAEVGPQIIGCSAMWMGDDAINICGDYYLVAAGRGRELRILSPREMHIRAGDSLQLVTAGGERLEDARAVDVQRLGEIETEDEDLIETLPLHRKVKAAFRHAYALTLDREVALPPGSAVASNQRMGNGFSVQAGQFGHNRSRGILIKASEGRISGNKLVNSHLQAIKIAPEFEWLESGFSRNVTVEDNEIIDPKREAILIKGVRTHPGHENLAVQNNVVRTRVSPAIRIEAVKGGRVAGNDVRQPDGSPLAGAVAVKYSEGVEITPAVAAAGGARPNILLCILDDASYPHLGAYGTTWVSTPHIDRLAKGGILFQNAYTPNAKCGPSRATVLTGRHSWELEQIGNHTAIWPENRYRTFYEALAQQGYHTGWTGKGWAPGIIENGARRLLTGTEYNQLRQTPPVEGISDVTYPANFARFLDDNPESKPWAFWLGIHEPHRPYTHGAALTKGGKKPADIDRVPAFWPDNEVVRTDMLDYAYELEYADDQLGQILKILEERGQLENTLIVVTADNGMPFPRSKGLGYEYSSHLPLVMMWRAGIRNPGRSETALVSFVDFAPTFLKVAGVEPAKSGMAPPSGRDLLEILHDTPRTQDRSYVLLGQERHDYGRPGNQGYPIRSIIQDGYLYLHNFKPDLWPAGNPETGYLNTDGSPTKTVILNLRRQGTDTRYWQLNFGKTPREQLYHIATDPECMINLAGLPRYADLRQALKVRLFAELAKQGDPRVVGPDGDIFDRYPWAPKNAYDFYERFVAGEIKRYQTGWVEPTDYETDFKE